MQREPSSAYEKIRNDTFRTLATDEGALHGMLAVIDLTSTADFKRRVGEDRLVRLLDAFVWRNSGQWYTELARLSVADAEVRKTGRWHRFPLCSRHERSGSALSIYAPVGTGSLQLLFQLHRELLSVICSADTARRASRA